MRWVSVTLVLVACGGTQAPGARADLAPDAGIDAAAEADDGAPDDAAAARDADSAAPPDAAGDDDAVPPADVPPASDAPDTAGTADADDPDDAVDVPAPDCPGLAPVTYVCDMAKPETCPGGTCIVKVCLGPERDPHRWDGCGDAACGACETPGSCPVDCAPVPQVGVPDYEDPKTVTVWVHGFGLNGFGSLDKMVYGGERGCDQFLKFLGDYGIDRPCADTPEGAAAPDQLTAIEYYGGVPAPWLTPADVAEIDAFPYDGGAAAERYARILAKFLRHKLASTGAGHVNLACHSMGCMLSRIVIERDLEGLVAEGRIARFYTFSGALAGARIARLYDNDYVKQYAAMVQMSQADFVILNPDFVADNAAWYDHRPWEGNSPRYARILVQHLGGTDPTVKDMLGITSLAELVNTDQSPDDGVLFTDDMYFHRQAPAARYVAPDGTALSASMAYTYVEHGQMTYADTTAMLGAAAIFHRRRVVLTLDEVTVTDDREGLLDGYSKADVAVEATVRYPYVHATWGRDVKATEVTIGQRTSPVFEIAENGTVATAWEVFGGPVFDDQDTVQVDLRLAEVDSYPHAGVNEIPFKEAETMAEYHATEPLVDHAFTFEGPYARGRASLRVVTLY